MSHLPEIIRAMRPLQVEVGDRGVILWWDDDHSYGYGYQLLVVPEGVDEAAMTQNNWSFHYTEKLQDGLWSSFSFH